MPPSTKEKKCFNPLHRQIGGDLIRRVIDGEWRPGDLLPSEINLASEYSVSLGTVRKAIDELALRKLIIRRQGKGTFVAKTGLQHEVFRFYRLFTDQGETVPATTEYLSCSRSNATDSDAKNLEIKPKSPITKIVRLRKYHAKGIVLERISIREDLCPGLCPILNRLQPISIYAVLEREYHLLITRVDERIYAVSADARNSQILKVPPKSPLLQVTRKSYTLKGDIVEYRDVYCSTKHIFYMSQLL